jgi:hypothetical protein
MTTERMMCVSAQMPYRKWSEDAQVDTDADTVEYRFQTVFGDAYDSVYMVGTIGQFIVGWWYNVTHHTEPQPPEVRRDRIVFDSAEAEEVLR